MLAFQGPAQPSPTLGYCSCRTSIGEAQQERAMISRRTKKALAAAKARGFKLGRQAIADANRDAAAWAHRKETR
jgi:hypothetical protein